MLLAASFRLSGESVNSTFLISESLEKRHSTAAGCTPGPRAPAPQAGRETPRTAVERSEGVGGGGRRQDEEEKEGQRAKTQLEERAEVARVSRTLWQPGAGRHTLSAPPRLPAAPSEGGVGPGHRDAESGSLPIHTPPVPTPGRGCRCPGSDSLSAPAGLSGKSPSPPPRQGTGALLPPSHGAVSRRVTPAEEARSYLIAHTPTLVCGSWSPFPVVCKIKEKEGREKQRGLRACRVQWTLPVGRTTANSLLSAYSGLGFGRASQPHPHPSPWSRTTECLPRGGSPSRVAVKGRGGSRRINPSCPGGLRLWNYSQGVYVRS